MERTCRRALSVGMLLLCFEAGSCGHARKAEPHSLLPELANSRSLIECLSAAKQGDRSAVESCAKLNGLPVKHQSSEPKKLDDYKLQLLGFWMFLDRDPARRLSISDYDHAVSYAKCVEGAAVASPAFSSRTSKGVADASQKARFACREHPLSMLRVSPDAAKSGAEIENAAQMMLANAISGLVLDYALEVNGWKNNEMRPCIRYADGRPPSPGCLGKPVGRPPAPPK